jgi:hypothetical protein
MLALVLPGCSLGKIEQAHNDYQKSTEKYDQCLAANGGAAQRCETLRVAMEADGRKYNEVSPNVLDQIKFSNEEKSAGKYNECAAVNRGAPERCEAERVAMDNERNKKHDALPFRPGTPPPDYADAHY